MNAGKTTLEHFEEKYIRGPISDCWLWDAGCSGKGYGQFWDGERLRGAHRVAFELYIGTVPCGLHVLHKCDVPRCVNPAHLWLGTNADNMADRDNKGRQARGDANGARLHPERLARGESHYSRLHPERRPRGESHAKAKLTQADVLAIRAAVGRTQRQLAAEFLVSHQQIGRIRRRELWQHVPEAPS